MLVHSWPFLKFIPMNWHTFWFNGWIFDTLLLHLYKVIYWFYFLLNCQYCYYSTTTICLSILVFWQIDKGIFDENSSKMELKMYIRLCCHIAQLVIQIEFATICTAVILCPLSCSIFIATISDVTQASPFCSYIV